MGWQAKMGDDKRRSLSVLLVALLWIGAGVFTLLTVLDVLSDDSSPPTSSARTTSAGPVAQDRAASTTSAPRTTPSTGSGSISAIEIPDAGPGVSAPGVLMVVIPQRGGAFDVRERVRLPDPVDTVVLSPPDVDRAGDQFQRADPVVTMVQLDVDGQPTRVPDGVIDGAFDVPVDGAITAFDLSYRLDGTSVRDSSSTTGSVLAAVAPLLDDTPYNLPVAVVVDGPVLSVGCPLLDQADRVCGEGSAERMQIARDLPFDDAVVTVEFDLPGE